MCIRDRRKEIDARNADKEKLLQQRNEIQKRLEKLQEERNSAAAELEIIQSRVAGLNQSIEDAKNAIIDTLNDRAAIKTRCV